MAGTLNLQSAVFRIALYTNEASLDGSTAAYTPDNEVSAPGYTAGGKVLTPVFGDGWINFEDVSWAGAMTARGALVYIEGGVAVCVLDFGADRTSTVSFTVQFPPATSNTALLRLK